MSGFISRNEDIMGGVPCFAGTRVPIQNLFDCIEEDMSLDEFLKDFPSVSSEAAIGVLELAVSAEPAELADRRRRHIG